MVNFEEHFLGYVFGFRNKLPAKDRKREAKHAVTMAANQFREGLLVATLHSSYELGIILHQP